MLAVRFLAHFDVSDTVAAFLDVGDLRRRIVGRAIQHGDRNHRRQVVGQSAGEEKIEAAVLVVATIVYVVSRMPGINRRNAKRSSLLDGIFRYFREGAAVINRAGCDLLYRIPNAVADVFSSMLIASIRRFRHQDTQEPGGSWRVGTVRPGRATQGLVHRAQPEHLPITLRPAVE